MKFSIFLCFLPFFTISADLSGQEFLTELKSYFLDNPEISLQLISMAKNERIKPLKTKRDPQTLENTIIDQKKAQRLIEKERNEEQIRIHKSEEVYNYQVNKVNKNKILLSTNYSEMPNILIDFKNNLVQINGQFLNNSRDIEVSSNDNILSSAWEGVSWELISPQNKIEKMTCTLGLTHTSKKLYLEIISIYKNDENIEPKKHLRFIQS